MIGFTVDLRAYRIAAHRSASHPAPEEVQCEIHLPGVQNKVICRSRAECTWRSTLRVEDRTTLCGNPRLVNGKFSMEFTSCFRHDRM